MPRVSHFLDAWLTDKSYKGWLRKSDDKNAFCNYCKKVVNVTNGGEAALKRHATGAKHQSRCPVEPGGLTCHTVSPITVPSDAVSPAAVATSQMDTVPTKTQTTISGLFERDLIACAEIRWCLKLLNQDFPSDHVKDLLSYFQSCFRIVISQRRWHWAGPSVAMS